MVKVKDIAKYLEEVAPLEQVDEGDNVGLSIGDFESDIEKAVLCLDVTTDVIRECADMGAKMIISHHPFIFNPINRIIQEDLSGRKIIEVIKNGINVYSAHTNLDSSVQGINEYIAKELKLTDIKRFGEKSKWQGGRIGKLDRKYPLKELVEKCKTIFSDSDIRSVGNADTLIQTVAFISGGAGKKNYLSAAIKAEAECYISADFLYHVMLEAYEQKFPLIICNHYSMERVILKDLKKRLDNKFKSVGFFISAREKTPLERL